jgi:hypothetical protein
MKISNVGVEITLPLQNGENEIGKLRKKKVYCLRMVNILNKLF